jgi:hypothetical protein
VVKEVDRVYYRHVRVVRNALTNPRKLIELKLYFHSRRGCEPDGTQIGKIFSSYSLSELESVMAMINPVPLEGLAYYSIRLHLAQMYSDHSLRTGDIPNMVPRSKYADLMDIYYDLGAIPQT